MIEVIKHGKNFYHKICDICGCEFLYQGIDVKLTINNDQITYLSKVQCPDCGTWIKADKKSYNNYNIIKENL